MVDTKRIKELHDLIGKQELMISHAEQHIIRPANNEIHNCERMLLELCLADLQTQYPDLQFSDLTCGHWQCEDSLLGHCVYDAPDDPCLDSCLYCGDPNERK